MKPFGPIILLLLPFLLLLGAGCTGSGDQDTSAPTSSANLAYQAHPPPVVNNGTSTRLEEYARLINQPKETVLAAWNSYSAANHLGSLGDLNLASEDVLRSFIGDF